MGNKSLKDIVDGSGDKEISDLVTRLEDSYIIKGLDWMGRKTGLKEYFPNSKLAKVIDFPKDVIFYGCIGFIPGVKHEKYTKKLGFKDDLLLTKYSLLYGFSLASIKFGAAMMSPYPLLSAGFGIWGIATLADDLVRSAYVLAKKKPIGSVLYFEIPYYAGKYLMSKKSKNPGTDKLSNQNLTGA